MTSSVDPTLEIQAVKARLDALSAKCYEGVDQGTKLVIDGFGNKAPYRDLEPGSTIAAARGRMIAGGEQAQPHIWAFQVHHVAATRKEAIALSIETDIALIGWHPTGNAGPVIQFFSQVYDALAKNGERAQFIASRYYEVQLGLNPDMSL